MENPQRLHVQPQPGNLEAQWVVGFVDGEGCFFVGINPHPEMTSGFQVLPEFTVVQHQRDIQLLHALKKFFGCGVVRSNHTAPKKLLERVQKLDISLVLYNCKFREHLKSGGHLRVRINANEEATFSVNKSDHPLRLQPPRLWLNVKSLRVLHLEPSLRIVPMSAGFLLPS